MRNIDLDKKQLPGEMAPADTVSTNAQEKARAISSKLGAELRTCPQSEFSRYFNVPVQYWKEAEEPKGAPEFRGLEFRGLQQEKCPEHWRDARASNHLTSMGMSAQIDGEHYEDNS